MFDLSPAGVGAVMDWNWDGVMLVVAIWVVVILLGGVVLGWLLFG